MKINSFSAKLFQVPRNINNNPTVNQNFKLKNDVFVRSTNLNFTSNLKTMDELYTPYEKSVSDYIMNSGKIEISQLDKLLKDYAPKASIKDFNSAPKKIGTDMSAGYSEDKLMLLPINGTIEVVPSEDNASYIVFPKDNTEKNRIILADRILHESTHQFQQLASDRKDLLKLAKKYVNSEKNMQKLQATMISAQNIFSVCESLLLKDLFNALSFESGSLPTEITNKNEKKLYKVFKNKYNKTAQEMAYKYLQACIKNARIEYGSIDKKYICDFIKIKAENEKEAYINALKSNKQKLLMNEHTMTDFDLRIMLYDELIKASSML